MPDIQFRFNETVTTAPLSRVDREKLYGRVKTIAKDAEGRECRLMTLAGDGKTLIGSGSATLGYFSPDGEWRDKKELTAVGADGEPIYPVPASLKSEIVLEDTADIDDLLAHNIRMAYAFEPETFDAALRKALEAGDIFTFPFSYRGGLDPDTAFLLQGEDGSVWMLAGKPADFEWVGPVDAGGVVEEDEAATDDEDDDDLDFGMM